MQDDQDKLLNSLIGMTSQRDQDALTVNLVTVLAEYVPVVRVSFYQPSNEKIEHSLEQTIHLDVHENNDGKQEYIWQKEPQFISTPENILTVIKEKEYICSDNKQNACLIAPVIRAGEVVGVLFVESKQSLSDYLSLLRGITKIYENILFILTEGERDTLTSLRNRRTFDKQLNKLLLRQNIVRNRQYKLAYTERRQPKQESVTWLVALDIDHFKRINDGFGHLYGDEVLLLLSHLMREAFRDTDLLFRFGGEEFVIILTATEENTHLVLDRFRNNIACYNFPQIGKVTLSIGYAQIKSDDFPPEILDKADKALYFAKQHGRNQVHCFEQLINAGKLVENKFISNESELF